VTDQIAFFGLPPLLGPIPKPPPLAVVATSSNGSASARTAIDSRAVTVAVSPPTAEVAEVAEVAGIVEVADVVDTPGTIDTPEAIEAAETVEVVKVVEVVADVDEPARSGRGQARRVAAEARQNARVDVQEVSAPTATAATESPAIAEVGAVAEVPVPGRSGRGSADRATGRSGAAIKDVAIKDVARKDVARKDVASVTR
jgi:hypothetical protein